MGTSLHLLPIISVRQPSITILFALSIVEDYELLGPDCHLVEVLERVELVYSCGGDKQLRQRKILAVLAGREADYI